MILGFSTQLNSKPTYFVEKIHKGFRLQELNMKAGIDPDLHYPHDYNFVAKDKLHHKIHTIREDKKDRWKTDAKIDFFINCRQKNMFRFAPVLPVVTVQKIEIKWIGFSDSYRPWVKIDGKSIYTLDQFDSDKMLQLAQNDGFDTIEDFFAYFNKDFTGKIIHWTDLKY
ncbi:hypothetical protein [Flavobacterium laiguense]|uniref:Uncharacterized protein n=1 Tax=Flavobacterium laiguense TaxID=2169409 RepID=A0A2U1K1T1_9FLAO|nr:hypothetical protein [Flavobacterium laiguense]PWA10953.1 hypothetical protein DB891_03740 [Flavobacterium laiguense]